ncbi:hypothetical protein QT327_27935 [Olivibacter sp. 47]|uniref:hypothetical protein n=1 Tax=Olivibacter sp. 47 TaxID=3056486 RepID=UPI0025A4B23E|nr:hypothetical protein [Olivibacter sp. 47]MDM8178145.1 hypothetical protein [Olivibacter sp. 47]
MLNRDMNRDEIDYYKTLLNELRFQEMEELFEKLTFSEIENILYQLAYNPNTDESNLLVYTLYQRLLCKQETPSLHMSISRLMGSILNHTSEQAELIGLYHGLRAVELDPNNIEIMEYLLYFNHIPEKLLPDSVAIEFAKKITLKKPESSVAVLTLSKLKF